MPGMYQVTNRVSCKIVYQLGWGAVGWGDSSVQIVSVQMEFSLNTQERTSSRQMEYTLVICTATTVLT